MFELWNRIQHLQHSKVILLILRDGYSMDPLLPKKEGTCDACGHKLVIREDDTEKVIRSRMEEYEAKTRPLLQVF